MRHQRIVVATDLTTASDEVVTRAGELAYQLGASLVGVHVLNSDRLAEFRETLPEEEVYDDVLHERLKAEVQDQLARCVHLVDTRVEVLTGHEAEALHHFALHEQADVLVVGIRNRSRVGKLLLGSTTQEILLGSPCAVLSVPVSTPPKTNETHGSP